jgi:hypothetical protein
VTNLRGKKHALQDTKTDGNLCGIISSLFYVPEENERFDVEKSGSKNGIGIYTHLKADKYKRGVRKLN